MLELDKVTVNRVILRAGEHCVHLISCLLTSLKMTEMRIGELWAFVKESSVSAKILERQYGRAWIWKAIDAPTRLLITFWIGGRGLEDARFIRRDRVCV